MKSLAIVLLFAPLTAFAILPNVPPETPPTSGPTATATASANAAAEAASASESSASSNSGGNSQAVSFKDRRQAPASFAPSIAPTAPCYYSVGGALSIPGGSIGGGKAMKDDACELRENIRLAYQMGLTVEADYLFCTTIGKDVPNCGKRPEPVEVKVERIVEACTAK